MGTTEMMKLMNVLICFVAVVAMYYFDSADTAVAHDNDAKLEARDLQKREESVPEVTKTTTLKANPDGEGNSVTTDDGNDTRSDAEQIMPSVLFVCAPLLIIGNIF